jgi:hypothetical protein
MSYAVDQCKIKFTDGQRERMLAMYEYYRYDFSQPSPIASPVSKPTPTPTSDDDGDGEDLCVLLFDRQCK